MPRDQRLYMTFPIDFLDHPKIIILSDNAVRTFVGMNGYSRVHNLDGRIPVAVAKGKWRAKSLSELQHNHPERPSLTIEGDDYVIHDYAEHQLTNADIEELRSKRAEAGRKGGNATAIARANAKQNASKVQAESESEIEIDRPRLNTVSHLPETGAEIDVEKVIAAVQKHCGRECGRTGAYLVIGTVMERAKQTPRNKTAFVVKAVQRDPFEFQKILDEAVASW